MKYTTLEAIFSASALLLSLPLTSAQTFPLAYIGCYGSIPGYSDKQTYEFQSSGHCAAQCVGQKVLYMALTAGSICYCGTSIPDSSNQVSETKCNTPCYGWGNQTCGGDNVYGVWADGLTLFSGTTAINTVTSASQTNNAASTTTSSPSVITEANHTVVVTATGQATTTASSGSGGGGSNTAGIAAGVVVGVVGLAAIVGASLFFIRRQKRRAVEESYRRNAAINGFVGNNAKPAAGPMSNSRWDGDFMAERRRSNGSIADDEDFSRRILTVTNPDR